MKTYNNFQNVLRAAFVSAALLMLAIYNLKGQGSTYVYWIHGFNDDAMFWYDFCEELTPTRGYLLEYDSDHPGGALGIASDLNTQLPTGKKIVLVGHSAGGLIARSIMNMNSNVIGIVTVGAPNKGSGIVSSVKDEGYMSIINDLLNTTNSSLNYVERAMDEIQKSIAWWSDYVKETINSLAIIRVMNDMIDDIDRSIFSDWVNENYHSPLFYDMDSSSNYMTNLNASTISNDQKVYTISGLEDESQLYRLLGTNINMDKIKGSGSTATYDTELIGSNGKITQLVSLIQMGIEGCQNGRNEITVRVGHLKRAYELLGLAQGKLEYLKDYVEVFIHTIWAEDVGAFHYEQKLVYVPKPIAGGGDLTIGGGFGGNSGSDTQKPPILGFDDDNYTTEWRTVKVIDPYDGLVGMTASHIDAADNVFNLDVDGVNHMEMGSHYDMMNVLRSTLSNLSSSSSTSPINPVIP